MTNARLAVGAALLATAIGMGACAKGHDADDSAAGMTSSVPAATPLPSAGTTTGTMGMSTGATTHAGMTSAADTTHKTKKP